MSLQNDLGLTQSELQSASPDLREKIVGDYHKSKMWDLLSGTQLFNRSSKRLDETTRAVRRMQGLKMKDDPEDEVVLGNKTTTINKGMGMLGAAAMLATGGGLVAAAPFLMQLLNPPSGGVQPPPQVIQQPGDPDSWSDVTPGFGEPQKVQ